MLTDPELRSKVDQIWDRLWSLGLSNPMDSIEQFSYLLFLKRTKAKQQDPEPIQLKLPGRE
jgi:type I restriction enzyme M protein